ncbi:MAG: hypothetical protein E6Q76_08185 [Rhizobium sp.]|nr:MAG: hypothetical protein E6Q76_08185 [Rhizobium sp.]
MNAKLESIFSAGPRALMRDYSEILFYGGARMSPQAVVQRSRIHASLRDRIEAVEALVAGGVIVVIEDEGRVLWEHVCHVNPESPLAQELRLDLEHTEMPPEVKSDRVFLARVRRKEVERTAALMAPDLPDGDLKVKLLAVTNSGEGLTAAMAGVLVGCSKELAYWHLARLASEGKVFKNLAATPIRWVRVVDPEQCSPQKSMPVETRLAG